MDKIDYDLLAAAMLRAQQSTSASRVEQPVSSNEVRPETGVKLAVGTIADLDLGEKSVRSWDDEVASEAGGSDSSASYSGGVPPKVGEIVRRQVLFGGQTMTLNDKHSEVNGGEGFFSSFVRGAQAEALYRQLLKLGIKMPKRSRPDLALCAYTAGTMPSVVNEGKKRLRGLACVGDAALTLHLVNDVCQSGGEAESVQGVRTKYTNDKHLSGMLYGLGLLPCVAFAPNVDPMTSKAGATAVEAIIGVMSIYLPPSEVAKFLLANNFWKL